MHLRDFTCYRFFHLFRREWFGDRHRGHWLQLDGFQQRGVDYNRE
jgi:hypothetical protein